MFIAGASEAGSSLTSQTTFQYDLVMLTAQVMSNYGLALHEQAMLAYYAQNVTAFSKNMTLFIELLSSMDPLMETQELFLFGAWIANATRWGTNTTSTNTQCNILRGRMPCGLEGTCVLHSCFRTKLTDEEVSLGNCRTSHQRTKFFLIPSVRGC